MKPKKSKRTALNVDFIQSKPLSKVEELELTEYIRNLKEKNKKAPKKAA